MGASMHTILAHVDSCETRDMQHVSDGLTRERSESVRGRRRRPARHCGREQRCRSDGESEGAVSHVNVCGRETVEEGWRRVRRASEALYASSSRLTVTSARRSRREEAPPTSPFAPPPPGAVPRSDLRPSHRRDDRGGHRGPSSPRTVRAQGVAGNAQI